MKRLFVALAAITLSLGANAGQDLIRTFQKPPREYRPQIWWHWMNGNITKESIRKDIEWMDRNGIAGFHVFDAGFNMSQLVPERLPYMSDGWKDAFRYALDLADSLKMEVAITSSPGWSLTGGPWVCKDDAMKMLCWSETLVKGGHKVSTDLPLPESKLDYYKDICVFAIRTNPSDTASRARQEVVKASEKAGFVTTYTTRDLFPTPDTTKTIDRRDIIDVTKHFRDGKLSWAAPAGKWRIYRFGYTLTGKKNGPASQEATGLEVDKLDKAAVTRYFDQYFKMYQEASGGRLGSTINNLMIDSYESRCQNWTSNMEQEFKARRGYDLRPWMPALAGRVVSSAAETERFLADWRRTIEDLMAESHYEGVDSLRKAYGLKRYTEAHEYTRVANFDGMDVRRNSDVPMAAFWMREFYSSYPADEADMREAASVAHIYGQNVCAGESFTTNGEDPDSFGRRVAWALCPANLKAAADAAMASGQNRFILHSCVMQPDDSLRPGITLGKNGMAYNRLNTWTGDMQFWTDYLSRSSFLLSQGRFVCDLALFYSEGTNAVARFKRERPDMPNWYSYDFINRSVLTDRLPLNYRAIVIDNEVTSMSLPVLRRFAELARSGMIIAGNEPSGFRELNGNEKEFRRLVCEIWHSGRPNVVPRIRLEEALMAAGTTPDLSFANPDGDDIRFVHRHLKDGGELYWIANINPNPRRLEASFRCAGRKPMILRADDGMVAEASYRSADGRTTVTIDFNRDDAVFVLFNEKTDIVNFSVPEARETVLASIDGPWDISFPEGLGAPVSATLDSLTPLNESPIPGIRHFSGTATYSSSFGLFLRSSEDWIFASRPNSGDAYDYSNNNRQKFETGLLFSEGLPPSALEGEAHKRSAVGGPGLEKIKSSETDSRLFLDLGKVHDMARVRVNGKYVGVVWKEPYRIDVTDAIQEGTNTLEIEVTNTWHNRIIGDLQPGAEKVTYTSYSFYKAGSPLREAGLAGPVKISLIN